MEILMELLRTDIFLLILWGIIIILLLGFIILCCKFSHLNRRYQEFMRKLGNGKTLEEDLDNYMYRVEKVEGQNANLVKKIQNRVSKKLSKKNTKYRS